MRTFLGGRLASVRERFFDSFVRANSVGLGTAADGSSWTPVSSSLNISANKAVSPNTNTNYPMATVDMPTVDNVVELKDTAQGSSAAIWVQGSNDWYLVGQDQIQTSYTYSVPYSYTYSYYLYSFSSSTALGTYTTYSWWAYF